ncbi:hypothetical protein [Aquibacillus sediminis]|uniref:hypothetical protein n=1 Tax=Aquibacillus sediminis TaxID=2574734 RepID=UPI0011089D9C|nr:hypothetical protein [Aquibacillus sediminis]
MGDFVIDGFIWQLIIVPIITIVPALIVYFITKKWWLAPLVTLVLTMITDIIFSALYHSSVSLSSWCIALPITVTAIVWLIKGIKFGFASNH